MSSASRTNTSANAKEFVLLVGTSSGLSATGIDMGMVEAVPCPLPSPSLTMPQAWVQTRRQCKHLNLW